MITLFCLVAVLLTLVLLLFGAGLLFAYLSGYNAYYDNMLYHQKSGAAFDVDQSYSIDIHRVGLPDVLS